MILRLVALALVAALALVGWQIQVMAGLRADIAEAQVRENNLQSENDALSFEITQAEVARQIAMLEVERQRRLVGEYDAIRRAFIQGDTNVPLPDDFRAVLDRLLGAPGDGGDADSGSRSGPDAVAGSDNP